MLKMKKSFAEIIDKAKNSNNNLDTNTIWLGFTIGLAVWFCGGILGLLWVVLQGAGTYWLGLYMYLTCILGVFVGGFLSGRRVKTNGWLHGLWIGLLLGFLGTIVNLEIIPQVYSWPGIVRQFALWVVWGLVGGYVGSQFKAKPHRQKVKGIK